MTLPGFEDTRPGRGEIRTAVEATLSALQDKGLLTDEHAALVQLIRSGADAVDRGLDTPKVSVATTTLYRALTDLLKELPAPVADPAADEAKFWQSFGALDGLVDTQVTG